ncbi:hypothetical protein HDV00_008732, partial [Rhizophlyctis rosea]
MAQLGFLATPVPSGTVSSGPRQCYAILLALIKQSILSFPLSLANVTPTVTNTWSIAIPLASITGMLSGLYVQEGLEPAMGAGFMHVIAAMGAL